MPEDSYSADTMILVARLYYIDNLPQAQIARLVNVSQSKISRMLSLARERGLVRISVPEYETRNAGYERQFRERFGVRAVVIRVTSGLTGPEARHALGYFAAPLVSDWIESNATVAIAGGRAMQAMVEQMRPPAATRGVTIVQAMGNIDSSPGPYDAVELGRALAARWKAAFLTLNIPAILPDEETCRQFLGLAQIRQVMEQLSRATLALVGIGTLENSVFVERGVLPPEQTVELRRAGAVGEMLGRFFNARGQECETRFRHRVVSPPLKDVRAIPDVAAVVTGADRCHAVNAAIRGSLIKSLVIDEEGAAAILQTPR